MGSNDLTIRRAAYIGMAVCGAAPCELRLRCGRACGPLRRPGGIQQAEAARHGDRLCNEDILSRVQQVICFAFHDSRVLLETIEKAREMRKIVTLFYLD